MRDAIVEKLRSVLKDGVDTEHKVVYVLSQCRKLLETYPPDPIPFALKLYCHWALHIDLDNPKHTLPFLERVDEFAGNFIEGNEDIVKEHHMFREFVFLETFKAQFKQFLRAYDLPTTICDQDASWHEFLTHYAGVIEDCSLSCRAKDHNLKHVSRVVFTKGRTAVEESHVPFKLSWNIILNDQRTLTVDVSAAYPFGREMIFHSRNLH